MQRLPGLDLLRAIAIVWVMLFHAYIVGGLNEHFVLLQTYGWIGVDVFFVLSGYLIGGQLLAPLQRGQPLAWGEFYLRRALRVLPAYFVVLALYFCWPAWREAPGIQPLWQFLSFSVNLLIDYQHNRAFSHVWSLCVEEHFYLVFPLLAWWLTRRPALRKVLLLAALVVIGGMLLRGAIWLQVLAPLAALDDGRFGDAFVEQIYYPTWLRLDGLLAGVLVASLRVYRKDWWARCQQQSNALLLTGATLIAAAMWLFADRAGLVASVFGYPLLSSGLGLLVLVAAGNRSALVRRAIPGAGWLARISYSLYLTHKAVFKLIERSDSSLLQHGPVLTFCVYAITALLVGAALHYAVERPFLRLRAYWHARRASALPQPA